VLKFEYQHSHLKVQGLCLCSVFLCFQYVSIYAAYLYDAVMLYARALDALLQKYEVVTEEDLYKVARNGTLIMEMLKNNTYESKYLELCAKTPVVLTLLRTSHSAMSIHRTQRASSRNCTKVIKNFMATTLPVQLKGYPMHQLHPSSVCCTLELLGIIFLKNFKIRIYTHFTSLL
jgi:hypothetical protein